MAIWPAMVALVGVLGGCGSASAGTPAGGGAHGSSDVAQTSGVAVGAGTATQPLVLAADRTTGSGGFRLSLDSSSSGSSGTATLTGVGLVESPSRYHLSLTVGQGSKTSSTEIIGYDGRAWTRSNGEAWKQAAPSTSYADSFVALAHSAQSVHDDGPTTHAGHQAEAYSATVAASSAAGVSSGPGHLQAWVDQTTRLLLGVRVQTSDAAASISGIVDIELSDFGTTERVTPP